MEVCAQTIVFMAGKKKTKAKHFDGSVKTDTKHYLTKLFLVFYLNVNR